MTGGHGHDHGDLEARLDRLEDPGQFRYLSAEELRTLLDPRPDWVICDLGSGTGFFTAALAPVVGTLYGVDVRPAFLRAHRAKGLGGAVAADVAALPFPDGSLDAATSVRTFHHGVADALDEVRRVLAPGGRFVVVDWSATGAGDRDRGPPPADCFDLATAQSHLVEAGFRIRHAGERRETFVVVASRRPD